MSSQPAAAHTLRLLLGDQLNPLHPWFVQTDPQVVYVLMEVRQETDYVLHHAQKILALFAAMRDLARQLRDGGHRVRYVAIDDPSNRQSLCDNLLALLAHYGAQALEYQAPDEWRLDAELAAFKPPGVRVSQVDSAHFYTARDTLAQQFSGRKQWLMEHFYRRMRRQEHVLLDDRGEPEGGQWNFDHDNRKPWSGTPAAPDDLRPVAHDHRALWASIQAAGVSYFGDPQAEALRWPLNRAEALAQLQAFVQHALPHFGHYEDAMSVQQPRLFHSLLSFALNTKMLNPREVVQQAEAAYRAGQAPLAAVEGFVRQILGWREYVRGIYWAHMPDYVQANALQHHKPLPSWFWNGKTSMRCLQQAVGESLSQAWTHHIQRLMVIGNFALLAGLEPAAVHRWYLGVYADAFEWVELPNTLGMSQFADGGLLATKPYVSSAAYLDRMGDACRACPYDRKQRIGERACPFNALYWHFFDRHAGLLQSNPRLALVYRQLRAMPPTDIEAIRTQAQGLMDRLETL